MRIFLVNDDDSLERLSIARYEQLLRGDPENRFEQYARKRVRSAMVILEFANRKPQEIIKIEYSFLHFDSDGRIDTAEQRREGRLAVEMLPPLTTEREGPQIIDARHKFARKRYNSIYRWRLSEKIEAAIVETIFGKGWH